MKDEIFIDDFSDDELETVKEVAKDLIKRYKTDQSLLEWFEKDNMETMRHYYPNNEQKQIDLFMAIYCSVICAEKNTGQMKWTDKEFTKYFYDKFNVREVLDKEEQIIRERKELEAKLADNKLNQIDWWFELLSKLDKLVDD